MYLPEKFDLLFSKLTLVTISVTIVLALWKIIDIIMWIVK
jgi:hypothetical protein